jgi:hypothetical protein
MGFRVSARVFGPVTTELVKENSAAVGRLIKIDPLCANWTARIWGGVRVQAPESLLLGKGGRCWLALLISMGAKMTISTPAAPTIPWVIPRITHICLR